MAAKRISNISFRGSVEVEQTARSERIAIGRGGTLRERDKFAADVMIEDVSETGCMFRASVPLPLGTLISIGIPGTGMHAARVSRVEYEEHGCSFLIPLSSDDIALAQIVETVTDGGFKRMREQVHGDERSRVTRRKGDTEPKPSKGLVANALAVVKRCLGR